MLRSSGRFHAELRQDQFDHLCDIASKRADADPTAKTSVNGLIVAAIDLYLSYYELGELKDQEGADHDTTPQSSGSGSDRDTEVSHVDDSVFYRYG